MSERFRVLDSFRGLSAVMIILFHSRFFQSASPNPFVEHGYVFVDFFFILSGFVMAHSYGNRIPDGIGFKRFVWLRLARIYPLHLFMLVAWIPFVAAKYYLYIHGAGGADPAQIQNVWTFVQNLLLWQGFGTETSWNYPSWSIGVEFYTYLVYFGVMFGLYAVSPMWRWRLLGALALGNYLFFASTLGEAAMFQNMFRSLGEFFIGVLVYSAHRARPFVPFSRAKADITEAGLLVLLVAAVSAIGASELFRHITVLLFALIVYVFAAGKGGYLHALLYLGERSYSIYMTHALLIIVVYEVLTRGLKLEPETVGAVVKAVIIPEAWLVNLVQILLVVFVSSWTYKHVELKAQRFLKRGLD